MDACKMSLHGTYYRNKPWHPLRTISSWVENPDRPPYVNPCESANEKKLDLTFAHICLLFKLSFQIIEPNEANPKVA